MRSDESINFDRWITYVFDHPVANPAWHFDIDADYWAGSAADVVSLLTRTFDEADAVLGPFSDAQVNQGLYFLVSNSCSDYMSALLEAEVPLQDRLRCIGAMADLYEKCFDRRCSPNLWHPDEPGASPLNTVCFMWWDEIPLECVTHLDPANPDGLALDRALLAVMERALRLDSVACQESTLHGLGHWSLHYRAETRAIIRDFLKERPETKQALKDYALVAYEGCIQ